MFDLYLVLNVVVGMYIWFETSAAIEWATLFGLKFFKYKEFEENKNSAFPVGNYIDFLAVRYGQNNFFVKVITCPFCLSVWCILILGPFFGGYLSGNILVTWILYSALKWIIKKSHE